MKITILNGNPGTSSSDFDRRLNHLAGLLETNGAEIKHIMLRDLNIRSCTGCFGCWLKTPGECLFEDDSKEVRRQVIHSDLVIFASPIIMGFTSALLKIMQDRLVPLVHPYIELVNNECHHVKRYDQYPELGLIYSKEPETDAEDIGIITDIYKRLALNMKSALVFSKSIDEPTENLIHEIVHH